VNKAYAVT